MTQEHPTGRPARLSPAVFPTLIVALALGFAAAASARVETGRPYLKQAATTPQALAREVSGDPQLLSRYAKHFQTSVHAVRAALPRLRATTLPAGTYTVWLTGVDGLRYPTVQDRSRPTPVFAIPLRSVAGAEVWLESGSGNPMEVFRTAERVEEEPPRPHVVVVEVPRERLVPVGMPPEPPPGALSRKPPPEPATKAQLSRRD